METDAISSLIEADTANVTPHRLSITELFKRRGSTHRESSVEPAETQAHRRSSVSSSVDDHSDAHQHHHHPHVEVPPVIEVDISKEVGAKKWD